MAADASDAFTDAHASTTLDLVQHELWQPTQDERDPLASHRPAELVCGLAGYYVERNALEIDTSACNYVSLEQPLLHDVPAAATLELAFLHFDLVAESPAQAHVALFVGEDALWETLIDIPGRAAVRTARVEAPRALHKGERVLFHLHNHGQNTWLLMHFARVDARAAANSASPND